MKKINFAIVGCGHIAKKHAEGIKQTSGATLLAVCDTIKENMEYYVEEYGATPYENYEEMLKNPEIDVINICTPSGSHAPLTIKAAKARKHVIVEKPIALTLKDANAMIDTCKENNVKLSVLHPNRFRPAMIELKKAMSEERFGKLSHANATVRWNRNQAYFDQAPWRGTKSLDGGVLMNQAIHNLDLLVWLMGDIEEIYSMSATRLRNIEAEDVSTGLVRFKSGALGVIEAATTIYPKNFEESLSIFGEEASVKIGGATANFIEHWVMESMSEEDVKSLKESIKDNPYGKPGHQCIIEDMIQAIINDRDPVVTGEEGIKALQLVTGLYQSAEKGTPLKVEEIE
ncbi:Gfo/Idh/MocA family oxidoreductase [Bacillus sp. FJAT-50079]|uniref:Gfo/Idh/MocA family protein n=1 Tax=Bacillus sp. FJAT-50079 TaxID=2833577 RepID=UPI001BC9EADA|nr:Gfo/Idh/MocA family oxidoreductase [Bacillus sp. FJAT-50079]MBS4206760.1 Gfo/Idh/MocA family oxidoreductase [Bacillus sp. FJAT-50079]